MAEQLPLFSTLAAEAEVEPGAAAPPMAVPPPPSAGTRPGPALAPASPLKAAIVAWCAHLDQLVERDELSLHTRKAFGGDLQQLAAYLGAGRSLDQIATRDLNDWLNWQRTVKKCSPKTYARRVTSLKSFFRWLGASGVVPADPAAPIIQQSVLSPLPEVLTDAEARAARAAADSFRRAEKPDPRPYVLFTLLLHTGIKKSECLGLYLNHVDLSNPDEPVLWVRYPNPRHRYKERKLRLDPGWLPAFREYLAQYDPRDRLLPWSPRRLEYMLEDISKAASLTKRISFDMCRWTCAVRDARAGVDFDHIRQKLGLSKIQWREIGMKLKKLAESCADSSSG
jgi:integrase/recombinase XerD